MRPNETVWKRRVSQTHAVTRRRRPRQPARPQRRHGPQWLKMAHLRRTVSRSTRKPMQATSERPAPFRSILVHSRPLYTPFLDNAAPSGPPGRHCFESPLRAPSVILVLDTGSHAPEPGEGGAPRPPTFVGCGVGRQAYMRDCSESPHPRLRGRVERGPRRATNPSSSLLFLSIVGAAIDAVA